MSVRKYVILTSLLFLGMVLGCFALFIYILNSMPNCAHANDVCYYYGDVREGAVKIFVITMVLITVAFGVTLWYEVKTYKNTYY